MTVKRIVMNIATPQVKDVQRFYSALFDLTVAMDLGWIATLQADETVPPQISIASQGGSETQVPDVSIEVDDVDAVYAKAQEMGCKIIYALTDEPWGVRRFYVRDPAGKTINVLAHLD